MPVITRAITNYSEPNRLPLETGQIIAVIDDRRELQFIKGQNLSTFEIGTFPRTVVDLVQANSSKNHISNPLRESFRHTGHGSAFGHCWGDPGKIADGADAGGGIASGVQLRSKTLGSFQHDRKQKCNSEQYVKERRLTAHKQFAYNKLKNDRGGGAGGGSNTNSMQNSPTKSKPERPPAPNVQKPAEEGVLIDLSPEEMGALAIASARFDGGGGGGVQAKQLGCLLDEPIDVPTVDLVEDESAWEVSDCISYFPSFQRNPFLSPSLKL